MIIVTIKQLSDNFKSYLQALNSKINAFAPYSFWDIIAGALAGLFLDLYANLQLIANSVFPQNAVGDQVDLWLYREGLPARQGETFAQLTVKLISGSAVIPSGTQFTSITTGSVYETKQAFVIPDNSTPFTLYAVNPGPTYVEAVNNQLSDGTINVKVQSSVSGSNEETDQSCINRILIASSAPIAGARATDYGIYCLQYNSTIPIPIVTDSIIIPAFKTTNGVDILGVFPLQGSAISNYQLDQGLLPATSFSQYTREIDNTTKTGVTNYIQSLRLVGLSVVVGPCVTEILNPIVLTVALVGAYNLSTPIQINSQDSSGNPIPVVLTIEQLVQRELRRAINNQPFGATVIGGIRYITLESLSYAVMNQLGENIGELAQVLTNITIVGGDIVVNPTSASTTQIYYTYDVAAYSDIGVSLQ